MNARRGPILIEHGGKVELSSPADAQPVPEDSVPPPEGAAMQSATALLTGSMSWFGRLFWSALLGLILLMLSAAAWDFATGLIARNIVLGRISFALMAIVGVGIGLVLLREIRAFSRLRKIDSLQIQSLSARADGGHAAAMALVSRLEGLYASREETRWGLQSLTQSKDDVLDGDALLALAETSLLGPLDALAKTRVAAASRQVAAITALVPLAFADVAVALVANVRMVRAIAEIYGGRAGFFGSWRLLRAVATHLVATGAVAVGDDMLGSIAGGGMLAKLSRRFGEGVINGALTARVGIAAMEVCRPMPFHALKRPGVSGITGKALSGLFSSAK